MIQGLPDRIHDCHQMNMLYPSIPKVNPMHMVMIMLMLMLMIMANVHSHAHEYAHSHAPPHNANTSLYPSLLHLDNHHEKVYQNLHHRNCFMYHGGTIKIVISEIFQDQAFGKYYSSPPETVLQTMIS